MPNFRDFVTAHRIKPRELFHHAYLGNFSRQEVFLIKQFRDSGFFMLNSVSKPLRKLNIAFALGAYISDCDMSEPEKFTALSSELNEEEWRFALKFSPYHKINTAFESLDLVQSALMDSYLGLNAALAGMDASFDLGSLSPGSYEREEFKAGTNLLLFSTLYSSYIDLCRIIREQCGFKKKSSYDRAIKKIKGKNVGAHDFFHKLRNYILHYRHVQPEYVVQYGNEKSTKLYLSSQDLLGDGFDWTFDSRKFLQTENKIDLIKTSELVAKDVGRLIVFHQKFVDRVMLNEKSAYQHYLYIRRSYQHFTKSVTDIGAAFKQPTSNLSRLIKKKMLNEVLISSLPDEQVRLILHSLANRYQNLSDSVISAVDTQITDLLNKRKIEPVVKGYFDGRLFNR